MASYKNILGFWSNDSKLDEKLGLTERQKRLVQDTWAIIKKDQVTSGVTIMLAYFKKHPEYQQSFKSFKDMTLDQLPSNKRFQAHCANIIATISNVIDSLEDFDLLIANIEIFVERHRRRGQTVKEFEDLKSVIAEILQEVIGNEYTPEVKEAWAKTLDVFFETIYANLV